MVDEGVTYAREWLVKARHDWRSAEVLNGLAVPLTDTAAFHCQQAAEKILKAYLTYHNRAYERIHDLSLLCQSCSEVDSGFGELTERVSSLTRYAVRFRYPGEENPTTADVEAALVVVGEVWKFALDKLPPELGDTGRDV